MPFFFSSDLAQPWSGYRFPHPLEAEDLWKLLVWRVLSSTAYTTMSEGNTFTQEMKRAEPGGGMAIGVDTSL